MKDQYKEQVPEVNLADSIGAIPLTRFAWGYDGTLVRFSTDGEDTTRGIYHNGWNDSFLRQPLPPALRRFSKARWWLRALYFISTGIIQPIETIKVMIRYINRPSGDKR
jgi:hypothetical protein